MCTGVVLIKHAAKIILTKLYYIIFVCMCMQNTDTCTNVHANIRKAPIPF